MDEGVGAVGVWGEREGMGARREGEKSFFMPPHLDDTAVHMVKPG